MKILFVHASPCIRTYKMAHCLNKAGHRVFLGQIYNAIEDLYGLKTNCFEEVFTLTSPAALSVIAENFDIIHCHNEPDYWTCMALAVTRNTNVKVIHDCHDWVVGRQAVDINYYANAMVANTLADLAVYVSDIQRMMVADKIGDTQSENLVIHNYPIKSVVPSDDELLPKIEGDEINLVYAGGISAEKGNHRNFLDVFKRLLIDGNNIYCYSQKIPYEYNQLSGYSNWHPMGHCSYENLVTQMSQYDVGLLPFNITHENHAHLAMGQPNKLYEYLSAGLPVVAVRGMDQVEIFLDEYPYGVMYDGMDDIQGAIEKAYDIEIDNRKQWLFDDEVDQILIPAYEAIAKAKELKPIPLDETLTFTDQRGVMGMYKDSCGKERMIYGQDISGMPGAKFEEWIGKEEDAGRFVSDFTLMESE